MCVLPIPNADAGPELSRATPLLASATRILGFVTLDDTPHSSWMAANLRDLWLRRGQQI